ncbi:hypothetical protein [Sphingomonas sanguinis]|uniref:terminase small subunit-like protein n=2 Tax=Sphingomonas sanguinis TaxID=33051 RepID=UPI003018584C
MAQKKLPKLDEPSKRALHCAARTAESAKALSELADRNLAESDTNAWRRISEEHKELILYRIRGGHILSTACRELGIDPATVRNLAALDEDFDKRLALASAQGQMAQVERLYEIPFDVTLSDAAKKLLSDNIKWIAARSNRKAWGDSLQVDQNVAVNVSMPTWTYGGPSVIDMPIDPDHDPDA